MYDPTQLNKWKYFWGVTWKRFWGSALGEIVAVTLFAIALVI